MRVAVGVDHAGFRLKETVMDTLLALGHIPVDVGVHDTTPVDYPDIATAIASRLASGEAVRGSGVGASIAANKVVGVRAALCHETYSAHQGVEHDDMNVLCPGGRVIGSAVTAELVTSYLGAAYTGEERHERRLQKVRALEHHHEQETPHA